MLVGGTTPANASVKSSAAQMRASAGVIVGIVKYLCLKNTVLQTLAWRVSVM